MKNNTQVTVFGATGNVGRMVVDALLKSNYTVVAFVRGTSDFPTHPELTIVQGDIYEPLTVARALEGSTVAISTLGSWGTPRKDILTTGMTAIIPVMHKAGIRRIISLTGADARATGDKLGGIHKLMHAALLVMAPKIVRDGEQHIALLEKSGLDWTVIRSPVMSGASSVGRGILSAYRPLPWQRISRRFVVRAIVASIDEPEWIKKAPYLS